MTHLDEVALPIQKGLISGLEELGFRNKDTTTVEQAFPNLPPFLPDRGPTASISTEHVVVGFGEALGADRTQDHRP